MTRTTVILALFMTVSWYSYGQKVIGYGTVPKLDSPWEQQLRWDRFLSKSEEKPTTFLGKSKSIDKVDPGMPIVVPPEDEVGNFPIKSIPKNFPSNMPIVKLPDTVFFKGGEAKPDVKIIPWGKENLPAH
jgi:hypothetical protein